MQQIDNQRPGQNAQTPIWGRLQQLWAGWSLARQFLTSASLVLLPAMWVMGAWVSSHIQNSFTHSAGTSAALYMENFLEPLVQELASNEGLSEASIAQIGRLLTDTSLGQRVHTFKIWRNGVVLASSRPELVGKRFPPSAGLQAAWRGIAMAQFDHLHEVENQFERASGLPLLEIYIPLRARSTDKVIAVGEFYEYAGDLKATLRQAQLLSWLVVSAVTLAMLGSMFWIVRRGSETILHQRSALERRVGDLTTLLAENRELRSRSESASARATETNEKYLRRLGADLHDGPAQLISLALMQAGERDSQACGDNANQTSIQAILKDALNDIRNIAQGLAVPEIEELSLKAAMAAAAQRHEALTGTRVAQTYGDLPQDASDAIKLCAYRFVQEGLANAFRHAGGTCQSVNGQFKDGSIVLEVADAGANSESQAQAQATGPTGSGLGLRGLSHRIESLGGNLKVMTQPSVGLRLIATLPWKFGDFEDA